MLIREDNVVTLYCDKCHKETRIFTGAEEDRDYYYCGHCGGMIRDEKLISKKIEEYTKLAGVVDIGERNYTF